MDTVGEGPSTAAPRAPLGQLSRLGSDLLEAPDIDAIARCVLTDLVGLPGVRRVGLALSEGGGRRLEFTASDRAPVRVTGRAGAPAGVEWCHIDAYDDVPLTTVVRTGEPIVARLDALDPRFAILASTQPDWCVALAAVPLPGTGSPLGGMVLFLDDSGALDDDQRRLLEAAARRIADAVRRVRAARSRAEGPGPEIEGDRVAASTGLVADPRSVGEARRFLRRLLFEWGVAQEVSDTAQLCLSELVTNAVVHAASSSELSASLDEGLLTVRVRDRGGPGSAGRPDDAPDPLRVHGRGLTLVDALADRWGAERDVAGTTVWFVIRAQPPAAAPVPTG